MRSYDATTMNVKEGTEWSGRRRNVLIACAIVVVATAVVRHDAIIEGALATGSFWSMLRRCRERTTARGGKASMKGSRSKSAKA